MSLTDLLLARYYPPEFDRFRHSNRALGAPDLVQKSCERDFYIFFKIYLLYSSMVLCERGCYLLVVASAP